MFFNHDEERNVILKLIENRESSNLKKKSIIYNETEIPRGIYYIKSGLIGLTKVHADGAESLLRVFKPGQFFGHRSFFSEESYHATSIALENSEIIFCNKEIINEVFAANPKAFYFLARALAKELRRAEERSLLISEGDVTERIASTLFLFKKLKPDHKWTRSEIAKYCASRTPTVIKVLGELENKDIIKQEGRDIQILDENGLLDIFL